MLTTGTHSAKRLQGCGMGKVKRGKGKAAKTPRKLTRADEWVNAAAVSDPGTYERFLHQVGIERVDEANQVRRDVFNCLSINPRVIVEGGRVVQNGTVDELENPALDILRKAGLLDDPSDAGRAEQRVQAGVELLRMGIEGNVFPRSTAAWRDVNGGSGGGPPISADSAENWSARCEMRYIRAQDVVTPEDWKLVRMVCVDREVPASMRRSALRNLTNALDLIGEYLLGQNPPVNVIRPKLRVRDRTLPDWLKKR